MLHLLRYALAPLVLGLLLATPLTGISYAQPNVPGSAQPPGKGQPEDEETGAEAEPQKPLTADDVQLYLKVMRASAERVRSLPASDRALLEKVVAAQSGKVAMEALKPADIERVLALSTIDEAVAAEMGVLDRYKEVPDLIASNAFICEDCGCDDCGTPAPSEAKAAPRKADDKAAVLKRMRAENALVEAHRKEIISLERQVHPLSSMGYMP